LVCLNLGLQMKSGNRTVVTLKISSVTISKEDETCMIECEEGHVDHFSTRTGLYKAKLVISRNMGCAGGKHREKRQNSCIHSPSLLRTCPLRCSCLQSWNWSSEDWDLKTLRNLLQVLWKKSSRFAVTDDRIDGFRILSPKRRVLQVDMMQSLVTWTNRCL
jgi:hypothetical protein